MIIRVSLSCLSLFKCYIKKANLIEFKSALLFFVKLFLKNGFAKVKLNDHHLSSEETRQNEDLWVRFWDFTTNFFRLFHVKKLKK